MKSKKILGGALIAAAGVGLFMVWRNSGAAAPALSGMTSDSLDDARAWLQGQLAHKAYDPDVLQVMDDALALEGGRADAFRAVLNRTKGTTRHDVIGDHGMPM